MTPTTVAYGMPCKRSSKSASSIPVSRSDHAERLRTLAALHAVVLRSFRRYIVASPTAKYNEPESVFNAPCDVLFLCATSNELNAESAAALAGNRCQTVVDGAYRPVSSEAAKVTRW